VTSRQATSPVAVPVTLDITDAATLATSVALLAPAVREQIGNAIADAESAERRRLTPGGFPYRQQGHSYGGSNSDRQSVGDPGHCEDCASVGHVIAHPDLGCGDVGCYRHHG
jgi:hypothetical protein